MYGIIIEIKSLDIDQTDETKNLLDRSFILFITFN